MKKLIGMLTLASVLFLITACDRKPFVEQKMKFEKVADGCNINPTAFKLTSNFGGERYEFNRCLKAGFTKEQMNVSRQGDTVLVKFEQPSPTEARAIFNITLDIDSYPKYNYITIDGDTYAIVANN